jgi:xylulokinase
MVAANECGDNSRMRYFLGIDVSTTATKALLTDASGTVRGVAAVEYGFATPQPLWSEQDPALWWDGAARAVRDVLAQTGVDPAAIGALGLTGQMHGLVLLDARGAVLRPAILWNDQRTQAQCDEIHRRVRRERFVQITGNVALTGFTAPKILWVREHEPELYARAAHLLLPKDYVRLQLTGEYAMDVADGAGTVLMDLRRRAWSDEVLRALDIPRAWMPALFEGPQVTGRITPEAAAATGLRIGTPVVAGGGDQAAQAVGVGAVEEGIVALTLGTSGVVFATTRAPAIDADGRLHAFCHAVPGRWHTMGVMLSAGGSLRWHRDTFAPGVSYDELLAPAGHVAPGADGLLFLPYLTGERTPHADPTARAAFLGLTVRHGLAHCTRAVLEGVAFGLRDGFELMKVAGLGEIRQVRASGGGARSTLWRQVLADVFGCELATVNTVEGAAYGAAVLAAVGVGEYATIDEACAACVRVTGATAPGGAAGAYAEAYARFRAAYPALAAVRG